jgi:very-short-patch-repair endonuclease
MTTRARTLRRDATFPERLLWRYLRDRQVSHTKFRRQEVIGPYVTDFLCEEHKMVVELDGHSHDTTGIEDLEREQFLTAQGFRVIRFMNDDVLRDVKGVVQAIADAIDTIREGKL